MLSLDDDYSENLLIPMNVWFYAIGTSSKFDGGTRSQIFENCADERLVDCPHKTRFNTCRSLLLSVAF